MKIESLTAQMIEPTDFAVVQRLLHQSKSQIFHYTRGVTPKRVMSFAWPISASLYPGNRDCFKEMLQRRRAFGDAVSNLIGPRFEPQTSHSRNERVIPPPTGRFEYVFC